MVGGLLATLTAAIDELAGIDLDTVDDTELHDAVVGLGALSSRLEAQWCRLIRRLGQPSDLGRQRLQSRPEPAWLGKPTGAEARPTVSSAGPVTWSRCPTPKPPIRPGRSTAPTSTWSPPVTASGATPPSPTPRSCWSTCVAPRSSGSPPGHRLLEAVRRLGCRRPRRRHPAPEPASVGVGDLERHRRHRRGPRPARRRDVQDRARPDL